MKIVENLIEITGPSIKALFLDMVVYSEPTLDKGECRLMGVYDDSPIYVTPLQVKPLLEPIEGERCLIIYEGYGVEKHVNKSKIHYIHPITEGYSIIALNPFTLRAEKDGILIEMVELCERADR